MLTTNAAAELFRHLSAEKATLYRSIMDVFASAKRQYRLQLRPDEVLVEADWPGTHPRLEEVSSALAQLAEWGNLESQPDTARVSSLSDFYRARFLYRLSHGGEAVEAGLTVFFQTLYRRAELQTVALEDITSRLLALRQLVDDTTSPDGPDVAKVHEVLRDLVRVFEDLGTDATPHLNMLLRRSMLDAGLATYRAKDHYQRQRPFATLGESTCTPGEEAKDGSYPSGHAALGWAAGLILAGLAPERSDALLQRGHAHGQSRVVCGVHWQCDVEAGRPVGAAAVARLQADPVYSAQAELARQEILAARQRGLKPQSASCAAEAAALKP